MAQISKKLFSAIAFYFLISALPAAFAEEASFCGFQCSKSAADQVLARLGALQNQSTALACSKASTDFNADADSGLAIGARKTMAMVYGSCDVLALPVRSLLEPKSIPKGAVSYKAHSKRYVSSRANVVSNHPYLAPRMNSSCSDAKACASGKFDHNNPCEKNACFAMNNPPLYQYGVKAQKYSVYVQTRRITRTGASSGLDCSGYISQAMSVGGARVFPDKDLASGGLGTAQFWQLGDEEKSPRDCFDRLVDQSGFKPGDLIVAPNNHIVMVDTVGADPFGIEAVLKKLDSDQISKTEKEFRAILAEMTDIQRGSKTRPARELYERYQNVSVADMISKKSDDAEEMADRKKFLATFAEVVCEQNLLNPEDFRMTITHSSPHGGHVGVQREKLFPGVGKPQGMAPLASAVLAKATGDCVKAIRTRYQIEESLDEIEVRKQAEGRSYAARILRHSAGRAGCQAPVEALPRIPGAECVACCSTQVSYEQMVPKNVRDDEESVVEENQQ